jgi:ribosomal protein S18 acetylase RimI-like enzyme
VTAEVRPARRDEIAAILRLWAEAAAEPGVPDGPEAVEALLDRDEGSLIVGVVDGELAGAIVAGWDGWRGSIYRLAVLEVHRREGLGLHLVNEAEAFLRARGARRIQALVYANDDRARAFWEAAGYALDERLVRYVRDAN